MSPHSALDRLRAWSALLPLLLLLAAAYWLNLQVQPLPAKIDNNNRHDPDFIISNFSATTLNEQGTPRFMIAAKKMLHYPDDDSTHLESPQLTSFLPDSPAMYVSAKNGSISGKGDEVFLRDEVKIVRAASAQSSSRGQSELIFTTTYLRIIPELDLADTDQAVTLTDAHNRINAVGMRLDNKARVIKLLSQVNSEHDVAKK